MFQEPRHEKKKKKKKWGNKILIIKKKEKTGKDLLVSRKLAGNGEKASFVEDGVRRSGRSLPPAAAFIKGEHFQRQSKHIISHILQTY